MIHLHNKKYKPQNFDDYPHLLGTTMSLIVGSIIAGAVGTGVGYGLNYEAAEDARNEQRRATEEQSRLGAAGLLEQQNFNQQQLDLQKQAIQPITSNAAEILTAPGSSTEAGGGAFDYLPGKSNNQQSNVTTWE